MGNFNSGKAFNDYETDKVGFNHDEHGNPPG